MAKSKKASLDSVEEKNSLHPLDKEIEVGSTELSELSGTHEVLVVSTFFKGPEQISKIILLSEKLSHS